MRPELGNLRGFLEKNEGYVSMSTYLHPAFELVILRRNFKYVHMDLSQSTPSKSSP